MGKKKLWVQSIVTPRSAHDAHNVLTTMETLAQRTHGARIKFLKELVKRWEKSRTTISACKKHKLGQLKKKLGGRIMESIASRKEVRIARAALTSLTFMKRRVPMAATTCAAEWFEISTKQGNTVKSHLY